MKGKGGTLKALGGRGTSKRTLDRRMHEFEQRMTHLTTLFQRLEGRVESAFKSLRELVNASNSSTLVVSCVERFLDEKFGEDWDSGVRKEVEARAALRRRRREIMIETARGRGKLGIADRNAFARELWGIARELDVRSEDAAAVVALHLQNEDVDSALDVVEEVRRDGVSLSGEVAEIVNQLVMRCIEVAEKGENELLSARAKSISAMKVTVL
jgi:hypothetical protein